jgi:hypothetical protein
MKSVIAFGVASAIIGLSSMSLRAQDRLRAGMYDVTVTNNGNSASHRRCVTAAEAKVANLSADAMRAQVEKAAKDEECTLKDFAIDGATVTMTMICSGVSVATKMTYRADAFDSVITTTSERGIHIMQTTQRRVGECP